MRLGHAVLILALVSGCETPFGNAPRYRGPASRRVASPAASRPAASWAPASQPAARAVLTVRDCEQMALSNNRRIGIADRRVLIARDRELESLSLILPKFTGEVRHTARNNDPGIEFPSAAQAGGGGFSGFKFGEREITTTKLSVIVPIYDFGITWHALDAQKGRTETARFDAQKTRQDLVLAVDQAYYRVLEARKITGVVEESIRLVRRQMEIAQDFFTQGLVARNDVLTAEVQLAERQQEFIQAANNVQLAQATLNRVMGQDVTQALELEDRFEVELWEGDFESVLSTAVDSRPDLAALRKQIEVVQAEYRMTRSMLLPYVYAFGDHNFSTDQTLDNKDWLSGGVAVTFPFFDGGQTYSQLGRKRKEIAEAIDLHDDRVDDIILEVEQAYLAVREAAARLPVSRKAIESAGENLRITADQYEEGLRTSADVLIEEDRLSRARVNYFRTLYDYNVAFARLVNASGGTPPVEQRRSESLETK